MDKMHKYDFTLKVIQEQETWFTRKTNNLWINHKGPKQLITGFMPENMDYRLPSKIFVDVHGIFRKQI